jgi:transposase InsO family protein
MHGSPAGHRPDRGGRVPGVAAAHGVPASVLTDNGLVYTTRFAGGRRGKATRNGFETELARLGIQQKNSSPNHPQTCGKVERFHQTLKKWLAGNPRPGHCPSCKTSSPTGWVGKGSQRRWWSWRRLRAAAEARWTFEAPRSTSSRG